MSYIEHAKKAALYEQLKHYYKAEQEWVKAIELAKKPVNRGYAITRATFCEHWAKFYGESKY